MKQPQTDWPSGLKRTKPREQVLTLLEQTAKPLSAMDICSEIEKNGESAWLSTVYRILELFVNKGMAVKIAMMNSDMALYELNRYQHKHYAVCISCQKIFPMENCPMEKFIPKIQDKDFRVIGHNLEVYGYCKDCAPK